MIHAEELADAILKAAGTGLRHYSMQKIRDEIIEAANQGLRAARDDALEEAAKVAASQHESWTDGCGVECDYTACQNVADAIRALKGKQP